MTENNYLLLFALERMATLFFSVSSEISQSETTQSFDFIAQNFDTINTNVWRILMKTVYNFLKFGVMALALTTIGATVIFAQDDAEAKAALYTKFTDCWTKDLKPTEKVGTGGDKAAIDGCLATAKEYLDKYGSNPDQYSKFVQAKYDLNTKGRDAAALATRFDTSINPKTLNIDNAFSSGRDFLAANPDNLDAIISLATIGADNAFSATPNDKYNADTVSNAKMAIQKIEAGKTSDNYGFYTYVYKTQKYPDGKSNALAWMNYYIGYIMYYRQNQKQAALPYLYKATQYNSGAKDNFRVYENIGDWYVSEYTRLNKDRETKLAANNNQENDEIKGIIAQIKGYAERAADVYSRAAKLAAADTAVSKEKKDALLTLAKQFYGVRYNDDVANSNGYDAYAAALATKPLVDPTTPIVPVADQTPTTTGTAPATSPTPAPTKPATMTKPATTPTKPSTTTTTKKSPR